MSIFEFFVEFIHDYILVFLDLEIVKIIAGFLVFIFFIGLVNSILTMFGVGGKK